MNRRTFLSLGLLAPIALKSGGVVNAAVDYDVQDATITMNFAKDPRKPKMTMWQLPSQHGPQMEGYVLRTETGETIVFDGGWAQDAPYLVDLVKKECGGKVDAWFLTHAHIDHCGALSEICTNPDLYSQIEIKDLYYNFPAHEWLDENEKSSVGETKIIFGSLPSFKGAVHTPEVNQTFTYGPLTMQCLNDFDLSLTMNAINNSSITYRLDIDGKSILILGDLGYEGGDRLVEMQGDKLCCDFCQMAHHGQQGVRRSFYELVKPSYTLWCTPDWLWRNDSGKGDGSGPFKTCDTRIWCAELGVKEYFVMRDGLIKLTF